jgi:hypothetical protein
VPGESRAGTGFLQPGIKTARDRLTARCNERHSVTPNRSFDVVAASSWLADCDKLQFLVFCLVHLSGGAPARGTEYTSQNTINTAKSMRTAFKMSGKLAFVTTYNKTDTLTRYGNLPVMRFVPDGDVVGLCVVLWSVLRPVMTVLRRSVHRRMTEAATMRDAARVQARARNETPLPPVISGPKHSIRPSEDDGAALWQTVDEYRQQPRSIRAWWTSGVTETLKHEDPCMIPSAIKAVAQFRWY